MDGAVSLATLVHAHKYITEDYTILPSAGLTLRTASCRHLLLIVLLIVLLLLYGCG